MAANLAVAAQLPRVGRKLRQPKHTWNVRHLPWAIQPICIAPVLPGETLTNLLMQSRAVSDPILDPICGWWLEYYFFYVKLQDLDARADLIEMIIDPDNADVSALKLADIERWSYTAAFHVSPSLRKYSSTTLLVASSAH